MAKTQMKTNVMQWSSQSLDLDLNFLQYIKFLLLKTKQT